jgi:hypothetical protein
MSRKQGRRTLAGTRKRQIADALQKICATKRWTVVQLAKAGEANVRVAGRWMDKHPQTPDVPALLALAVNAQVSVDWLLTGEGEPFRLTQPATADAADKLCDEIVRQMIGRHGLDPIDAAALVPAPPRLVAVLADHFARVGRLTNAQVRALSDREREEIRRNAPAALWAIEMLVGRGMLATHLEQPVPKKVKVREGGPRPVRARKPKAPPPDPAGLQLEEEKRLAAERAAKRRAKGGTEEQRGERRGWATVGRSVLTIDGVPLRVGKK